MFRELLLNMLTVNNLPLRLVESLTFLDLIYNTSLTTFVPSRRTIAKDLKERFYAQREILKNELLAHICTGGRLSLMTDGWPARNGKQFAAYTVSWTDENWKMHGMLLDIIHHKQAIHSGSY